MRADAYDRARKLLSERQGAVATAIALGVVHSVLLVVLLATMGLVAGLIASEGVARYPANRVRKDLPAWVTARVTGLDQADAVLDDTGLLPIATANLSPA